MITDNSFDINKSKKWEVIHVKELLKHPTGHQLAEKNASTD